MTDQEAGPLTGRCPAPRQSRRPTLGQVGLALVVAGWVAASSFGAAGLTQSTSVTTTPTTEPASTETTAAATTTIAPATTTTAPPGTTAPSETTAPPTDATAATTTTTTLSAEERQEKARAVANLNLARAADEEIASQLRSITEAANRTVEKIEEAKQRLERAQQVAEHSAELLTSSGDKQQEIEASLRIKAIEGYKSQTVGVTALLLTEVSVNDAIRQNQLLSEANSSTAELLEELRALLEDRRLANAEAELAAAEAEQAQAQLEAELATLEEQQLTQIGLKTEAERRVDQWAGELTAYAQEDAAIQALIGQSAAPAPADTAINNPTNPSALGFQWPIQAPVTSEYGYRIHPVYGTRRLHSGIDLGAPGGTPIAASNDGVVIFAGTRGGYGQTVLVDHGGGIVTLYGHMSRIGSVEGQRVARGDIVGFVGATGTATGNHLHFEVRVNGGPVNPRNYLP